MKKIGMKVESDVENLQFQAHALARARGSKMEIRMSRIRFYSVKADQMGFFGIRLPL